jgi:hypothetical protein
MKSFISVLVIIATIALVPTSIANASLSSSHVSGHFYGVSYSGPGNNYTFLSLDASNISIVNRQSWISDPYHIDVSSSLSVIQGGQWHAPVYINKSSYGIASFDLTSGEYTVMELPQRCQGLVPFNDDQLVIITSPENAGKSLRLPFDCWYHVHVSHKHLIIQQVKVQWMCILPEFH